MTKVNFDISAFWRKVKDWTKNLANVTALIRDNWTINFDALTALDKLTRYGLLNLIENRCKVYEKLHLSNGDASATAMTDMCLLQMW